MPPLRAGGDGLAQPAHLRLVKIRETDARHGIGGNIASQSERQYKSLATKIMQTGTANEPNQPLCDPGGQSIDRESHLQRLPGDY